MSPTTEQFYGELAAFTDFVEVTDAAHYRDVPDDWLVVITDVKGSTRAIEQGRYKDVNALGVASIVALRNALGDLRIPYVFGGDGATLLVPESRRDRVERALRGIVDMAERAFELSMRAGLVSVAELRADGHAVRVARYQASPRVDLAMMSGSGFSEAERRIKDPQLGPRYQVDDSGPPSADFSGFECRWRPIPSRRGMIISLLVRALASDRDLAATTYRRVLEGIQGVLAEQAPGRPVALDTLALQRFGDPFDQEARIRAGGRRGLRYLVRSLVAKLSAFIGALLMKRGWNAFGFPGRSYRDEVVANTDFRKFDDTLRMVLDVNAEQRRAIETLLGAEHDRQQLAYGIHAATTSIMTCAIGDYTGEHVHFVDGSDGGYALAAKQLKYQLATDAEPS